MPHSSSLALLIGGRDFGRELPEKDYGNYNLATS
jgi:hypothetical protein